MSMSMKGNTMITKLFGGVLILTTSVIVGGALALSVITDGVELMSPLKVEAKQDYRRTKLQAVNSNVVPIYGDSWDVQPALGYRVLQPTENPQLVSSYSPQGSK